MSTFSDIGVEEEIAVSFLSSWLHCRILDILAYGMYTSAFFVALYLTLTQATERRRVGSAALITGMWIFVTVHACINWAITDYAFILHGESRETQFISLLLSQNSGENFFPQRVADTSVTFISLLLADLTMIWRCWVLYQRRWLTVIIPCVFLLAGTVCYILRNVWIYSDKGLVGTDKMTNVELTFLLTTVFTNIFCTGAIIYRLVSVSGWRKSLKTYRGLVEILIESSILYTAVYLIRVGLRIHSQYFTTALDERAVFPQALGFSITGLAPTLIIARVAAGHARPDDDWTRTSLPHMRSTMKSLAESLRFAQPATGTVTDDVDLERSIRSEVSVAADGEAPSSREKSKEFADGRKTQLGEVTKDL